jgi:O-antigen/teichoic acid export membrane protein
MGYFIQTVIGTGWMGALRVFSRGLGFIKLAVVARLLTPVDFGVFGIAAIVLAFLEIFTETGIYVFLIQEKENIDEYIDTSWIISIIRGLLIGLMLFIFGSPIAEFFHTPNAAILMRLMGIVALVRGLINPSIIKIQKELDFRKEFFFRDAIIFTEVMTSLIAVFFFRSPISLVIGILASAILEVILSLALVHPKPRMVFDKNKFFKMISKGKWVTAAGILGFLAREGDSAVVAKLMDSSSLGLYQIAYKIAILPGTEITDVVSKVTFPVYAKIEHDKKRLLRAFLKTTFTSSAVIIPISLFVFIFPEFMLRFLVGEQWLAATSSLRILALFGVIGAIIGSRNAVFFSLRRQDLVTKITLVKLIVLSATIVPLVLKFGIVGSALACLISVLVVTPLTIYYLVKVFNTA